ncbi:MAG TPA: hypothetical protein VK945_06490 [Planococcus sp. (in: firmicutes)]|nr:hypothetical protein [Planococcus sp. (in: firmicutes)]
MKFDIIGDIHGCFHELMKLFGKLDTLMKTTAISIPKAVAGICR